MATINVFYIIYEEARTKALFEIAETENGDTSARLMYSDTEFPQLVIGRHEKRGATRRSLVAIMWHEPLYLSLGVDSHMD